MRRGEFMMRLSVLLNDVPEEEKTDALKFYNNYFDDAGPENEEKVIEELGDPEKVAQSIRECISEDNQKQGKDGNLYPELVTRDITDREKAEERAYKRRYQQGNWSAARKYREDVQEDAQGGTQGTQRKENQKQESGEKKSRNNSTLILIVILAVFASPILLGLASGGFGIVLTILVCILAVLIGFGAGALACFLGGIGCLILGIMRCLTNPVNAVMICGVGMVLLAIGFLFCIVTGLIWGKLFPAVVHAIRGLCGKLWKRRSEA